MVGWTVVAVGPVVPAPVVVVNGTWGFAIMFEGALTGGPMGTRLATLGAMFSGFVPFMNASVKRVDPCAASTTAQAAMVMASAMLIGLEEPLLDLCGVGGDIGAGGHGCRKGVGGGLG